METHSQAERLRRAAQKALSAIEPTRRSAVAKRAEGIPSLYRAGYVKAAAGLASPREAIKAHCLECVGWIRAEVTACTAVACPLFAYRPFRGAK